MAQAQKEKFADPSAQYYTELGNPDLVRLIKNYLENRRNNHDHKEAFKKAVSAFESELNRKPDDRTKFEFSVFANGVNGGKDYEYLKKLINETREFALPLNGNKTEFFGEALAYARLVRDARKKIDERKRDVETIIARKLTDSTKSVSQIHFKVAGQELVASISNPDLKSKIKNKKEFTKDDVIELVKGSDYVVGVFSYLVIKNEEPETKVMFGGMSKNNIIEVLSDKDTQFNIIKKTEKEYPSKEYEALKKEYSRN